MQKNELYPFSITGYTSEGLGVARVDGRAVFVQGAVCGDIGTLRLTKVSAGAVFARIESLDTPSEHRVENDCPVYPRCGGCALRHMSYAEECRFKRDRVTDALRRIGGITLEPDCFFASDNIDGYRNKAAYPVGYTPKGAVTGYYRARTHEIIPVDRCRLLPPEMDIAAEAVRGWLDMSGCTALRHILLRRGSEGLLVCLIATEPPPDYAALVDALRRAVPVLCGVVWQLHDNRGNAVLGRRGQCTLWGSGTVTDTLTAGGRTLEFRVSARSFFQINRPQAERLYQTALEFAGAFNRAADLYCGTGTMTLLAAAARPDATVIGVEVESDAVDDARGNANRNGITNAEFLCDDVAEAAQTLSADTVFLDPPRKGLSPEALRAVAAIAPERVVYMSCDPATLARDCKLLCEQGYRAERLAVADFFPRTAHVECLVLLVRC